MPNTLAAFLTSLNVKPKQYGNGSAIILFERDIPLSTRHEMYRLTDWVVASAVSGPGWVLIPRKPGAGGWPLTPSLRHPGELVLACPQCLSLDVVMTVAYGPGGRLGDPGAHNVNRCKACGFYSLEPAE
jgi:hypothetical protein